MNPSSLVDLYVPGNVGPFEEVAEAAARAGLDAVVWVAESPEALPPAAAAAHERGDRAAVHGALVLEGPGYRMLVLAARARLLKFAATAGALGSPADIADAARLAGGVALAVSPRQGAGGAVCREPAALPGSCVAGNGRPGVRKYTLRSGPGPRGRGRAGSAHSRRDRSLWRVRRLSGGTRATCPAMPATSRSSSRCWPGAPASPSRSAVAPRPPPRSPNHRAPAVAADADARAGPVKAAAATRSSNSD
jgi:hypothetical protein